MLKFKTKCHKRLIFQIGITLALRSSCERKVMCVIIVAVCCKYDAI